MKINFENTYANELGGCYTDINISPLENVVWADVNPDVANLIGIDFEAEHQDAWLKAINGEQLFDGMRPIAQVYAGHQFGGFSPQLGDGRGVLAGEIVHQQQKFDIHIKGIGLTPYSRMGDGRAVLRSSIREYLASEALHHLNIPTTRALGIATSDSQVVREKIEKGALLVRVAQSHIRFGHFEYFYYSKQPQNLTRLIDYTLTHHFPECKASENPVAAMLTEVAIRTGHLIARWQANGFAHGVMNTDNMSIVGDTLDYGPYGFLDEYDPGYICNHSDYNGRYAFDAQPGIALWNLNCLAHALSGHASREELTDALSQYEPALMAKFVELMKAKFGLVVDDEQDRHISAEWLSLLEKEKADYTRSFRLLCDFDEDGDNSAIRDSFIDRDAFDAWATKYAARLTHQALSKEQRQSMMRANNPKYILRNYLAQNVIDSAESGDFQPLKDLLQVLRKPFDEQPENENYAALPPDWGKKMVISCSS